MAFLCFKPTNIIKYNGQVIQARVYKCDGCGKIGSGREWSLYASYAHMETCPHDLPAACSDKCIKVIQEKIKSGEYVLPRLQNKGPYFDKISERQGY